MKASNVRLLIDLLLLAAVGLAVLFTTLFASPFVRGFYCNDDSIKYPHKTSTISSLAVGLAGAIIPLALIAVVEGTSATRPRVRRWLHLSGVFLFGLGVAELVVDTAKYSIGRLRPHFLDVCIPDLACGVNDVDYHQGYQCLGADEAVIEEARKSFPSGHASVSFYAAVFSILYLQYSLNLRISRLARPVIQLVFLLAAWFTALSRVMDYQHHWSDVTVGILIGSGIAVANIVVMSDLCHPTTPLRQHRASLPSSEIALEEANSTPVNDSLPTTQQDRSGPV